MLSCAKQKMQQTDKCTCELHNSMHLFSQGAYYYVSFLDVHVYSPQVTMFKDIARIVNAVPVTLYSIVTHSTTLQCIVAHCIALDGGELQGAMYYAMHFPVAHCTATATSAFT